MFNLFINSLARYLRSVGGVTIPRPDTLQRPISQGRERDITWDDLDDDLAGHQHSLLFADDVALLAQTELDLQAMFSITHIWAKASGMELGYKKCASLATFDLPDCKEFRIVHDDKTTVILPAKEYKYLGITLNKQLDLEHAVKTRCDAKKHIIQAALQRMRGAPFVPPYWRRMHVMGVILPTIYYGVELLVGNAPAIKVLQDHAQQVAHAVVSFSAGASTEPVARAVADIPPVAATVAKAAFRLFIKAIGMRPSVRLMSRIDTAPAGSLSTDIWGAKLKKCLHSKHEDLHKLWLASAQENKAEDARRHVRARFDPINHSTPEHLHMVMSATDLSDSETTAAKVYSAMQAPVTQKLLHKLTRALPSSSVGWVAILSMRASAYRTASRLFKKFPGQYAASLETTCPFCDSTPPVEQRVRLDGSANNYKGENEVHILTGCPYWQSKRVEALTSLARVLTVGNARPGRTREGRGKWDPSWSPSELDSLPKPWQDFASPDQVHTLVGAFPIPPTFRHLFAVAWTAAFLALIDPDRSRYLALFSLASSINHDDVTRKRLAQGNQSPPRSRRFWDPHNAHEPKRRRLRQPLHRRLRDIDRVSACMKSRIEAAVRRHQAKLRRTHSTLHMRRTGLVMHSHVNRSPRNAQARARDPRPAPQGAPRLRWMTRAHTLGGPSRAAASPAAASQQRLVGQHDVKKTSGRSSDPRSRPNHKSSQAPGSGFTHGG